MADDGILTGGGVHLTGNGGSGKINLGRSFLFWQGPGYTWQDPSFLRQFEDRAGDPPSQSHSVCLIGTCGWSYGLRRRTYETPEIDAELLVTLDGNSENEHKRNTVRPGDATP
jgi:hypothetical protein